MAPPVKTYQKPFNNKSKDIGVVCDGLVTVIVDSCLLPHQVNNEEARHELKNMFKPVVEDALMKYGDVNEPNEELRSDIPSYLSSTPVNATPVLIDATRQEGITLRKIGEEYMKSHLRRRIRDVAYQTDIKNLNYEKFCQIMSDLHCKSLFSINEGLLVVLLAYFKDLICRAFEEQDILKACHIIWYFVKYAKANNMIMKLKHLFHTLPRNWIYAGVFFAGATTIAVGIYAATGA